MKKGTSNKSFANAPRLQSNILLICLGYGFTGVNLIVSSILANNSNDVSYKLSIMLGIVMLCMVPISYFDPREDMRGKLNAIMSCIMHLVFSLCISYFYSSWRTLIVYAIEVLISMSIVYLQHKQAKKTLI